MDRPGSSDLPHSPLQDSGGGHAFGFALFHASVPTGPVIHEHMENMTLGLQFHMQDIPGTVVLQLYFQWFGMDELKVGSICERYIDAPLIG
jgi:hypothetical protein